MKRLALIAALLFPSAAAAAPPANDAPAGALEFEEYTAANGMPDERQAVVDLTEATADRAPRCLGGSSFAKTVWFKVPAGDSVRRVVVEASSPSGGTSEVPDLALYVGGQSRLAQACDGAAVGKLMTSAAAVEAVVPAGKPLLVQVGRSGGQVEQRVIASLRTQAAPAAKAPAGDTARKAPFLTGARSKIALRGATLTAEDPAQPACPAPATVWRKTELTRGRYRIKVRGTDAGSVTAFLGKRPTADNAVGCENRRKPKSALTLVLAAKRGAVLWTRIGADDVGQGAKVTALVKRLSG